jgi:hypothetical protein
VIYTRFPISSDSIEDLFLEINKQRTFAQS